MDSLLLMMIVDDEMNPISVWTLMLIGPLQIKLVTVLINDTSMKLLLRIILLMAPYWFLQTLLIVTLFL